MAWFEPARMMERGVLRALTGGFALVVTLLGVAGFVAVRGTRAIEEDAAQVGREQLAMARLLNEVQAGQNSMAAILHRLAPGHAAPDREKLLRDLEAADRALSGVAESAGESPEAAQWKELESAVRSFSSGVRAAVAQPGSDLAPLFDLHDSVVRVEQQLLQASERRLEESERRIETESRELASNSRILLGLCLVLALLCAFLTVTFARSSIRKIERQASDLSRVSWHMLQDQESLARRFSHELHDELGQSLAAVKANLSASQPAEWPTRRVDCMQLVDGAIANVREMSQLLHPVILDDFGLDAGLRWLTDGFAQRTGLRTNYVSTFNERLDDETETHLFRIAQEALTNVARHSGASVVRAELVLEDDGHVRMAIEDNGRGLRGLESQPSIGLIGMRARAREIGASLRFDVPAGGGLRVEVAVPRRRQEKEADDEQQKARLAGG